MLVYTCNLAPRPSAEGGGVGGGGGGLGCLPGTHCSRMHQISRHAGKSVALVGFLNYRNVGNFRRILSSPRGSPGNEANTVYTMYNLSAISWMLRWLNWTYIERDTLDARESSEMYRHNSRLP